MGRMHWTKQRSALGTACWCISEGHPPLQHDAGVCLKAPTRSHMLSYACPHRTEPGKTICVACIHLDCMQPHLCPHLPSPCNCLDKCVSVLFTTCKFVSLLFTSTKLLGVSTVRVGGAASVGACLYVCCWHVHILVLALHARPLPGSLTCVYVHLCVYICTAACVWDMCGLLPVCMS